MGVWVTRCHIAETVTAKLLQIIGFRLVKGRHFDFIFALLYHWLSRHWKTKSSFWHNLARRGQNCCKKM